MTYFIYILKSLKDNKLYIGQTNNLQKRIARHNKGEVKAARNRLPLVLIYNEIFQTRKEAMRREIYFKSLKNSKYIIKNFIAKR